VAQANVALRFLLELAGIVAVAYWGYHAASGALRWVLAIGAPVSLIVVWALVIAPGANVPVAQNVRVVLGSVVLLLGAMLLYLAGQRTLALALGLLVIVNTGLMFTLGE
jgi:hypothetical protein